LASKQTRLVVRVFVQSKDRVNVQKLYFDENPTGGYIWVYDNDNIEPKDIVFGPAEGWEHPFQLK
jgi:hypothetical protein